MNVHAIALYAAVSSAICGCYSGNAPVGDPCEEKEQCSTGLCLQAERYGESTGWSDGYCTEECTATCHSGAKCVAFEDASYCMSPCIGPFDCRDGYVCNLLAGACIPDCRLGFDCGTSLHCTEVGVCVDLSGDTDTDTDTAPSTGSGPIGAPCQGDADCASGVCIPQTETRSGQAWLDGSCSQSCGTCPLGSHCQALGDESWCLKHCFGDLDCRDGYVCSLLNQVCLPDCRIGFDCGPDLTCNARGLCTSSDWGGGGGPGPGGSWLQ